MNQTTLKNFAQSARRKLLDLIGARLDYVLTADTAELRQQASQVSELRTALQREGRDQLLERVAYTWFNRLAALRFMDANGYHPFGARVLSPATASETLPELLQQARAGALDPDLASIPTAHSPLNTGHSIAELLAGRIPAAHPEASIYRLLLVAACNYYYTLMPFMFEKLGDATELLLPDDLLTEHSIVHDFRTELADDDCRDVEVIGWLYQYYISERKTAIMGRDGVVPQSDMAPRTQLFTNHWIVRYLVDNSLGRLWLRNRPNSRLREKMPYYIEDAPNPQPSTLKLQPGSGEFLKITKPEEIRLLDPASGSGHMLTYAFDLLHAIYEEEGYDAPQIPSLILQHNLHGVEICDRAAALTAFALCMKARARDSRFFRRSVQPNAISLQDVRFEEGELSAYFRALGSQPSSINLQLAKLLYQFEDAKNFGSLIQPCLAESEILAAREKLSALSSQLTVRDLTVALTHTKVLRVFEQAEHLSQRYHVVVANPPYMGSDYFNLPLKGFASSFYKDGHGDLFAMFIMRMHSLVVASGYAGLVTMEAWMFLGSYEKMRKRFLASKTVVGLVHMPYEGRGRTSLGINFGTTAFAFWNHYDPDLKALCVHVTHADIDESGTPFGFPVKNSKLKRVALGTLNRLPGCPVAYWLPETAIAAYITSPQVSTFAPVEVGLQTSSNHRFVRFWHEIDHAQTALRCTSDEEAGLSGRKWFPFEKGGDFRKWAGNCVHVVNWATNGAEIKAFVAARYPYLKGKVDYVVKDRGNFFKKGVSWNKITTGAFSARANGPGFIFSDAGMKAIAEDDQKRLTLAAFLNSKIAGYYLDAFSQSMNTEKGSIQKLPLKVEAATLSIPNECIALATEDWDNFETSWNFRDLPLLRSAWKGASLEASWQNWKVHCDAAIRRMQQLETENNRLFIAAYGLQEELQPEVPEDQITLARADARKDMAAFLSYAVGCMMGRYSLDAPGLILANAGATVQDYARIVAERLSGSQSPPAPPSPPLPLAQSPRPTFTPDEDGILPVLDGEWFSDDIVGRFREFLRATFGEDTFTENLAFLEASLGKDLRKYFAKEFYKDHLKTYKKRPIYWMFSSPEGSFQALIYLHRYTRDTVNLLLNDYLREFIQKLEERHRQLTAVNLNEAARPADRTRAVKELAKIDKMLKELRAWERDVLLPLAQQRLELDLDDGVKVNYLKFKGAVVNIPGLDKSEEE